MRAVVVRAQLWLHTPRVLLLCYLDYYHEHMRATIVRAVVVRAQLWLHTPRAIVMLFGLLSRTYACHM